MTPFSKRDQTRRERPDPPPRGGLRPRSQTMAARLEDEYAVARKHYLLTHRECEVKVRGHCTRWAREIHHRAGRTGAALSDPEGFVAACRACHRYVEEHREWARDHGFVVKREVRRK